MPVPPFPFQLKVPINELEKTLLHIIAEQKIQRSLVTKIAEALGPCEWIGPKSGDSEERDDSAGLGVTSRDTFGYVALPDISSNSLY